MPEDERQRRRRRYPLDFVWISSFWTQSYAWSFRFQAKNEKFLNKLFIHLSTFSVATEKRLLLQNFSSNPYQYWFQWIIIMMFFVVFFFLSRGGLLGAEFNGSSWLVWFFCFQWIQVVNIGIRWQSSKQTSMKNPLRSMSRHDFRTNPEVRSYENQRGLWLNGRKRHWDGRFRTSQCRWPENHFSDRSVLSQ